MTTGPGTAAPQLVEWGRERARVRSWHADQSAAYLLPFPDAPSLSIGFLRRCLDVLADRGFTAVLTPALAPSQRHPFLAVGFEEHEHLHLLTHDLTSLPRAGRAARRRAGYSLRRGSVDDHARVLEIDAAAFPPFWHLDAAGLDEALAATPRTRFRVAVHQGGVVAYAIGGRAGRQGYLQRLAVHPAHQRAGLGSTLVVDSLRWMRRRGALNVVVNTQVENQAALALYERLGFRLQPAGLAVLRHELTS